MVVGVGLLVLDFLRVVEGGALGFEEIAMRAHCVIVGSERCWDCEVVDDLFPF